MLLYMLSTFGILDSVPNRLQEHLTTFLLDSLGMVSSSTYFVFKNSANGEFKSLSFKTQMT